MGRTLALLMIAAFLGGCAAPSTGPVPVVAAGHSLHSSSDSPPAMPGTDSPPAMPGTDSPPAMPGTSLACAPSTTSGSVSCSLAININVAAIENSTLDPSLVPGYHPSDLQAAYGLTGGGSETVAIVDAYDDPTVESDLNVYRSTFGLGACTSSNGCLRKIDERGGTTYPAFNTGWSEEIAIDTEMVSAICPHCKIVLVEADSASLDDLGTAVDTAVAQGAHVVSNSYYAREWSGETAYDVHFNHAGIAMTASSGDQAYASYPATSPYVTAVGGTTLSGNAGSFTQTAWTPSGHGCSAYEARPAWQKGLTTCTTRAGVDVAAIADPQHGVAMYDSQAGGWLVAGGTSVGAPIIAAAYALASNGATVPYAYAHVTALQPIEGAPYGTYTGLGTPKNLGAF